MNFISFKIVNKCLMIKIKFLARKFCIKILFRNHYVNPLSTFIKKGRIQEAQKHTDPTDVVISRSD
jgi:hypothetical protein